MSYIGITIAVFLLLFLGFELGKAYVAYQCSSKGRFKYGKSEYEAWPFGCLSKSKHRRPEFFQKDKPIDLEIEAFAEGTLDKIKLLTPGYKNNLKRNFPNLTAKEFKIYDCVQCCKDAGDIQRTIILCPICGNKRCPKAQYHSFKCTNSNEVNQHGKIEKDQGKTDEEKVYKNSQLRLNGKHLNKCLN